VKGPEAGWVVVGLEEQSRVNWAAVDPESMDGGCKVDNEHGNRSLLNKTTKAVQEVPDGRLEKESGEQSTGQAWKGEN